jgi:ribosomal protein L37E
MPETNTRSMNGWQCPTCGKVTWEQGVAFCVHCGQPVSKPEAQMPWSPVRLLAALIEKLGTALTTHPAFSGKNLPVLRWWHPLVWPLMPWRLENFLAHRFQVSLTRKCADPARPTEPELALLSSLTLPVTQSEWKAEAAARGPSTDSSRFMEGLLRLAVIIGFVLLVPLIGNVVRQLPPELPWAFHAVALLLGILWFFWLPRLLILLWRFYLAVVSLPR